MHIDCVAQSQDVDRDQAWAQTCGSYGTIARLDQPTCPGQLLTGYAGVVLRSHRGQTVYVAVEWS